MKNNQKISVTQNTYQHLMESLKLSNEPKDHLVNLKKPQNLFTLRLDLEAKFTEFKIEVCLLKIAAA